MKSLLVLLALAAAALADNPRPSYNSYDYPDSDPVYQYGYNVAAAGGYDNPAIFAQDENRNGYETHADRHLPGQRRLRLHRRRQVRGRGHLRRLQARRPRLQARAQAGLQAGARRVQAGPRA